MCRFLAYSGEPVFLTDLVCAPTHSLVHQSLHAAEAKTETNGASGVLRNDNGARELMRQLGALTNRDLNPAALDGEPSTLGELGVATNRDGTLTLNTAVLQSALLRKNFDAAVAASSKNSEAMLKLVNEAFQPISTRVSLAVEKIKTAA